MMAMRRLHRTTFSILFLAFTSTIAKSTTPMDDIESENIRTRVQFALQCHAKFGLVSNVVVLGSAPYRPYIAVFGSYNQYVSGTNLLIFKSPVQVGGIFDAEYDPTLRKLTAVRYRVSFVSGEVDATCLR